MKNTILAAAVAAIAIPSLASAQFEPSDFQFVVDPATGVAFIDSDVEFGGFQLQDPNAALLPENLPFLAGSQATGLLDLGGVFFSVLSDSSGNIAAGSTASSVQPGIVDIGAIFPTGLTEADLDRFLVSVTALDDTGFGTTETGEVVFVPEPATAGVLGVVALGMLRRRRA
jgi:hypothetical protein